MYNDLLPFVNDDELYLLFLKYNYIGEDFTKPINRPDKKTIRTIQGEPLFQLFIENNYIHKSIGKEQIYHDLINVLFDELGAWHGKIDNKVVTDVNAKKIFDRVFLRWKDLSPLARKFYSTHMYLTRTDGTDDIVIRDFDSIQFLNPSTIKLHLKKTKDGQILFKTTLPHFINDEYIAHELYQNAYNDPLLQPAIDRTKIKKLDYSKFITNVIKNYGRNVDLYKYAYTSDDYDDLDDLYVEEPELVRMNFTRNKDGVLVRDGEDLNDAKLEMDLTQAGICYGTGIKNTGSNCNDVYRCLLDVKPDDVSKCSVELENENLFNVDINKIRNINPRIMRLILQNLGVKIYKQNNILICESYENWLSSSPLRKIVIKNRNLSKYISTIINVINSNPIILNPMQTDKKLYGLSTFKIPVGLTTKPRIPKKLEGLLYTKNLSMNPLSHSIPLYPDNMRFLVGGGEYSENAAQLRKLFTVLISELDKAGVPLVKEDQDRIFNTIERMSKLELDLPRLLENLKVYTDLIKLIDDKETDKTIIDDFKDIITNKAQLNELVSKVNKKIQSNIIKQNLILQTLYTNVQLPLIGKLVF
jgi:hypothetical protein